MNKADLIEKVKDAAGLSKSQAESAVDQTLDLVVKAITSGERVSLFGFGTFNPSARAARTGRNPQTGAPVKIAASKGVRFTPAAAFKAALNPRAKKAAGAKKAAKASPAKKASAKKAAPAKKAPAKKASPAKKAVKSTKKR